MIRTPAILTLCITLAAASAHAAAKRTGGNPADAPAESGTGKADEKVAALKPAHSDNDVARWLAGLPAEGGALEGFSAATAWKNHTKALDAAWENSEKHRIAKLREWAPEALGAVNTSDSPVFYFFSGADFLYPHALFPNAKTYVMCAREPVGAQPNPTRIPPGELSGALAGFRGSVDALLGLSFFRTIDLRKDVTQRHIPGILPVIEMLLARDGGKVSSVELIHCNDAGELDDDFKAKKGSPGARIKFRSGDKPEQTIHYFYGDISNDGLKTHGGVLKFAATFGKGRSLLKAASYLPHESHFSRINEWVLANSTAIVQDPSGIPMRGFPKGEWTFKFWGRNTAPIKLFANKSDAALREAVAAAPAQKIPFGFGYQHEPSNSLLILAERKTAE